MVSPAESAIHRPSEVARLERLLHSTDRGFSNCSVSGPGGVGKSSNPQTRSDFFAIVEGQLAPRRLTIADDLAKDYFPQTGKVASLHRDLVQEAMAELKAKTAPEEVKRTVIAFLMRSIRQHKGSLFSCRLRLRRPGTKMPALPSSSLVRLSSVEDDSLGEAANAEAILHDAETVNLRCPHRALISKMATDSIRWTTVPSATEIIHLCLTAYTCLPPHPACSSAIQTSSTKVSVRRSR